MVSARKPFIALTTADGWAWDDPAVQTALAQAQAGVAVQVLALRDTIAARGAELTDLGKIIVESARLNAQMVALDGQHASSSAVNERVRQVAAVHEKLKTYCGIR